MALREGCPRARFQVAFERQRPLFVREFDQNINLPRTSGRCVRTLAGIVCLETVARSQMQVSGRVLYGSPPSRYALRRTPFAWLATRSSRWRERRVVDQTGF